MDNLDHCTSLLNKTIMVRIQYIHVICTEVYYVKYDNSRGIYHHGNNFVSVYMSKFKLGRMVHHPKFESWRTTKIQDGRQGHVP